MNQYRSCWISFLRRPKTLHLGWWRSHSRAAHKVSIRSDLGYISQSLTTTIISALCALAQAPQTCPRQLRLPESSGPQDLWRTRSILIRRRCPSSMSHSEQDGQLAVPAMIHVGSIYRSSWAWERIALRYQPTQSLDTQPIGPGAPLASPSPTHTCTFTVTTQEAHFRSIRRFPAHSPVARPSFLGMRSRVGRVNRLSGVRATGPTRRRRQAHSRPDALVNCWGSCARAVR